MALLTKPNMNNIWASGGDIVEPTDLKKQQGWTAEVPPFQYENWIQNRQDQYLAHINQRGIPAWDGQTEYEAGGLSYVQGSDGKVYKSVAASGPTTTIQDPTTDATDTYWTVAFADMGAFLTPAEGDVRYAKVASNLSDLTNVATARTNLSVYSKLESDGLYLAKAQNLADLTNTTTARTNLGAAPIVSPTFTGTPTAPTAAVGTNTTQIASTAFVQAQLASSVPVATDTVAGKVELATNAEAQAGVDTSRAITPSSLNSTVLGMGQTWQDLTASRTLNTTYTNTTGRPIMLMISIRGGSGDENATLNIGGVVISLTQNDGSGDSIGPMSAVIPAGSAYSLQLSIGTIQSWSELR